MSERTYKPYNAVVAIESGDQALLNKGVAIKAPKINHISAEIVSEDQRIVLHRMDLPSGQALTISDEHDVSFIGRDEMGHGLFNIQGATEFPSVNFVARKQEDKPRHRGRKSTSL